MSQAAAATQYLVNGGFESGDFSGWTLVDPSGSTTVESSFAYGPQSGTYYVYAGPPLTPGSLSQTFTDVAGQHLTISGYAIGDVDFGPGSVTYLFNNVALTPPDLAGGAWTHSTYDVIATGSDTFAISFLNETSYNGLDNFTVTSVTTGVPELPTWTLALAGFAALGLWRQRARTA